MKNIEFVMERNILGLNLEKSRFLRLFLYFKYVKVSFLGVKIINFFN